MGGHERCVLRAGDLRVGVSGSRGAGDRARVGDWQRVEFSRGYDDIALDRMTDCSCSLAAAVSRAAELFGFATVKTDKDDYASRTTVRITGERLEAARIRRAGSARSSHSSTSIRF